MNEKDPSGADPHIKGAKLDAGKSPVRRGLLEYFPRACLAVADISAAGASKYTWNGWESVPNGIDRYGDAEVRHICKAAIEGQIDKDFGLTHAAHEAWNALARLELVLREREGAAPTQTVPFNTLPVSGDILATEQCYHLHSALFFDQAEMKNRCADCGEVFPVAQAQ